ncbi:MAG: N-carbamoyl-D-amino-acid hydrolase [Candidatus Competibacterales bacterium]
MARPLVVAAAQLGPIQRSDSRATVVERLVALLHRAAERGVQLVVFPELALTTFFPRWYLEDPAEIDAFFETEIPGPVTAPLFAAAARRGVGFHLGYAELAEEGGQRRRYNTAITVAPEGRVVGKYRKVHLPGHADHQPWRPFQHLEKYYFDVGDLGFPAFRAFGGVLGMLICNDRRWPEAYRMLGLQGVELIMIGYNTPIYQADLPAVNQLQGFHNHLCLQAGAYQNATWVVATAKAGVEEGCELLGQSAIIAPTGEIVALAHTLGDELISYEVNLDACRGLKETVFNFAVHRQPQHYHLITGRQGAEPPP